ncbi:MAG TPA: T9SS type A sorting domain-containing protein [Puia sp.]|nr:T9SS type A sorting domain-containing protein [Puia sp.]
MKTFYQKQTFALPLTIFFSPKLKRIFTFALLVFINARSTAQINVLMQHNNLKRTGWNSNETQLTQANVSGGNFGKIFSRQVDDQIYTQPLIMSNVSIGGGTHNIVIVTTVNNSVYAFDADDASASTAYWQVNLTYSPSTYRPIKNTDMTGACGGNYQDFSGNMGIVGTPVIDSTANTMYVVARSVSNTGTTYVQYLHALDIATGAEKPNSPVYITATYPGTGDGSSGGVITFSQQKQNQRPGLLLYNGVIYIAWSSHCDWGPYHGWVIGYDASTLTQKYVYNDSKNGGLAGIWMSGQAPAVDDDGNIYVTTGNGTTGSTGNANDTANRAESLLKLSSSSGTLKIADFFTPNDYAYLNNYDLDYGVDGVMLIPNTNLSLSGSKESYLYLIDNTHMGGTTTDNSNVLEVLNVNATSTNNDKHVHGSPVYYQDNNGNEFVYVWGEEGLLKQFPFKRPALLFDTLNQIIGKTQLPSGMPGAMLSVSSNGTQQGTGILWTSHPINGDANHATVPGILQAFDATDVTHELWNSNMSGLRDSIGRFAKFVVPTIANGKVYMATFSNMLNVYGLNPPSASACPNALPAPWQSADIGYVVYAGDVCYNNGTYTTTASGDDIWGTVDAFHYVYQPVTGTNVEIIARVVSVQNTNAWAKAGVMFRSNLDAGGQHAFMAITPGNGAAFQNRTIQNGGSLNTSSSGPVAPYWVRVLSKGNKYVGYISADGSSWTAVDSLTVALGSNSYVGLAYTTHDNTQLGTAVFDNVSVVNHTTLPVNIINFTAKNINNKYSQLNWTTSSEMNNDHFEIERSGVSSDFKSIGTVKSNGNSSSSQQYAFKDTSPLDGTNYYRIKQVDINGNFQYSTIATATFNLKLIDIFPNPAHKQLYIRNNSNFSGNEQLTIAIFDVSGKTIYKQQSTSAGGTVIPINIPAKVMNGMYVVKVTNSKGDVQARKIFITR